MAIRVRAMLRKWFGRGMYPTAGQFSDLFDSFLHKTEDEISIDKVEGLAGRLNDKYDAPSGRQLEANLKRLKDAYDTHERTSREEFKNIADNIEELEAEDERLREEDAAIRKEFAAADVSTLQAAKDHTAARETAIRKDMTAGDAATLASAKAFTSEREGVLRKELQDGDTATLQAAKDHTNDREAAIRKDMTAGDAATLASAKAFTSEREGVLRKELQDGDTATLNAAKGHTNDRETAIRKEFAAADASTLQAAKDHTAARETAIRSDITAGDAATLASAKAYIDKAIEQILNGSPEALDTLKELADALGNDPNFAATVTKQLGQKVDKVTGKGLSTEDYTTADKQKLAGIATGANNYQHPSSHPATMIAEDSSHRFVTDAEKTAWSGKADKAAATASAAGLMSAADKKKLDGVAAGANNYQHPSSHPATMIAEDSSHRFVTDAEKTAWSGKADKAAATASAAGLMSAADKKKLDGVAAGANNYQHPSSHPATMIAEDSSHRFITDAERKAWNEKSTGIPSLDWRSKAGYLWVRPAASPDDPGLDGLEIGLLHYKNAKRSSRPQNRGFKIVQDNTGRSIDRPWTNVSINPIRIGAVPPDSSGWIRLYSESDLFYRWVHPEKDPSAPRGERYFLHRGVKASACHARNNGQGPFYRISVYLGVVLFRTMPGGRRIEGPRSYFKVVGGSLDRPRIHHL